MSDNWVVQNLENALETWNEKLSEIWTLITQSPQSFKGGTIWSVITTINGAVQAITLSTCEYSRTNGRMVVVAKKIASPNGEVNPDA